MFRFFETLVDPYTPYEEKDAPPQRLLPFLWDYARPFRMVFALTAVLKMAVALAEVALVWYVGRLVDLLASASPEGPRIATASPRSNLPATRVTPAGKSDLPA